ncbi:MAG: tetratricopeptide repeat protein [Bacteroidales bacterium]|nr:tetratricopeptide repeat protein [Bacteroidales bacterium]
MKRIIVLLFLMGTLSLAAQTADVRREVRKGNRAYKKDKFDEAQTSYQRALTLDSTYYKALYNQGNALYRQKNFDDAARHYGKVLSNPQLTKEQRRQALHNLGNSHLQAGLKDRANGMQHFQQAVDSYKQALLIDPKNEDTRYNLAYAQKLLQQAQQQQQGGGGNNNQDKNQDKNQQNQQNQNQQNQDQQNNQNQNQQQDQQNNQNQQNQQEQQQRKGENQQKSQQQKDAERLLEAVQNNEKKTLKEQQRAAVPVRAGKIEKDW